MALREDDFSGEIIVASRIIEYLSSGLYKDPASCLKELINNSYDADAKRVDVFVKPDANRIIIEDDGDGMDKNDFLRHFSRISESHKRDKSDKTRSGRPKVGKIGIGFIAANEICDVMEIFSTKRGSTELLHVKIDFEKMREPIESRRREKSDFAKADYVGEVLKTDADAHFTRIFLQSVRGAAKDILAGAKSQRADAEALSIYGLTAESVTKVLKSPTLNSWKDFDTYSETMLRVGLNVPVKYSNDWLPKSLRKHVKDFEAKVSKLNFSLFYDGTELRKPTVFRPTGGKVLVKPFRFKGVSVSAAGYFYIQHKTIKPIDLQGLLVRVRNAAIGEYDSQFWGFSPSEAPLIQRWVSAEIWASDELEEAMNIDRRTLRDVHPAYVELRDAIHLGLRGALKLARQEIYESGSAKRKKEQAIKSAKSFEDFLNNVASTAPPPVAKELKAGWKKLSTKDRHRVLLEKYSVVELYDLVLAVAQEVLAPRQQIKFIKSLMDRLRK